jgi:septum formation protein
MAERQSVRLILASGSQARRELLAKAGYTFEAMPADVDEPTGEGCRDIRAYVQQVAWLKAAAVAAKVRDALVLAADTVGWVDGRVIGKPADETDAKRILRLLGGREHELWTGVCLWRPDGMQIAWQEVSRVQFRRLSDSEMDEYLATRQWRLFRSVCRAGGHDPYVRVVEGTVSNVIGLPVETLGRVCGNWLGLEFRPRERNGWATGNAFPVAHPVFSHPIDTTRLRTLLSLPEQAYHVWRSIPSGEPDSRPFRFSAIFSKSAHGGSEVLGERGREPCVVLGTVRKGDSACSRRLASRPSSP